jgi:hypothetical protein
MHYIKMELKKYVNREEGHGSFYLTAGILISCKRFTGRILNVRSSLQVKQNLK